MQPNISIVMLSYYHEKYIKKAIESILCQVTDLTYELIIADDCSKDATRKIISDYANRYPDKIKPIYNEINLGITKNLYNAISHCTGKYISFLSGDDFWIDEKKLEKQYQFLEEHKEYVAVTGVVEARLNGKEIISCSPERRMVDKKITLRDYLSGRTFDTHSVMIHNFYNENGGKEYMRNIVKFSPYIDDSTTCILILKKGPAFTMSDHFGVYRVIKGTANAQNYNSKNTTFQKAEKEIELYSNMTKEFDDLDLTQLFARCLSIAALTSLLNLSFSDYRKLYNSLPKKYKNGRTKCAVIGNMIKTGKRVIKLRILSFIKGGY